MRGNEQVFITFRSMRGSCPHQEESVQTFSISVSLYVLEDHASL